MEENKSTLGSVDLESTDYDPGGIGGLDYRMEAGRRDAVFFHTLGIVCTVLATIWMYAFGTGDPMRMTYFLGMPLWISGAICIYLVMFVVGMVYIARWEEFPLTARFHKGRKRGGEQA